ncbi:MAG: MFS transporter [Rickettsiales bacterium]|nr:MAG: MFS transporter [Rickettsiales bacterium]
MNLQKIFADRKQRQIFILGIYSGMPLSIIYSTLPGWIKGAGVDIAIITTLALARIFYSLKFLWAPFVDQIRLPILHKLGRRKSWMCLMSGIIAFIIFSYSRLSPEESFSEIYILTLALGFCSATLDIAIDAFRIDTIKKEQQAIAAANAVFGYRVGMLVSNAGVFFMIEDYGWEVAFMMVSSLYVAGLFFMMTLKEPKIEQEEFNILTAHSWKVMTINPFMDFLQRKGAVLILLAVVFYKLGDAMLGVVATPFYLELGFSYKEIAAIAKVFGLIATLSGAYIGGFVMYRFGSFKGLIIGAIAQSITNLSFIWLNHMGHDTSALMVTIVIENIASGMGDAALVGYLSHLCNKQYSATQYALLSSASGLFSHSIVTFGGTMVKAMGWNMYFLMTVFLAIPGIVLLLYLNKKDGFADYDKATIKRSS